MSVPPFPELRVWPSNGAAVRADGEYVLYWMTANRRVRWNFALERAAGRAMGLRKPLLVFEGLRVGYPWASDRHHRFILDGMAVNARRLARKPVLYYPYVEPKADAGKGLLLALAERASVVVTDHFPCFFHPRMVASAARKLPVLLEEVDASGLLPVRATEQVFPTAYAFRRFLQKNLRKHILEPPAEDPLQGARLPRLDSLPPGIAKRWPTASGKLLDGDPGALAAIPVDHTVGVAPTPGGSEAGEARLAAFLERKLARYAEDRNVPDLDATSGLSPYLHHGHVSVHEILARLGKRERWDASGLPAKGTGQKAGWWGMEENAEAFLDELVTWRELGCNTCEHREGYDRYDTLPGWAQETLRKHAGDRREPLYSRDEMEGARTHDPLWNAAQTQLLREGRIHNYLRMLWGKKILEWSPAPEEALARMIEWNNRYALDGRDPNSYAGIFWVLGRFDRPWGPERPVFGTIRFMSSANTARKLAVRKYLERWGTGSGMLSSPDGEEENP